MSEEKEERRRSSKPPEQVKIANERIQILFKEADKRAKKGQLDLSDRYVRLARKIGMRYNVKIPKDLKRKYCKYCYSFLRPGVSSTQRVKRGIVNVKCLKCNRTIRYPIK